MSSSELRQLFSDLVRELVEGQRQVVSDLVRVVEGQRQEVVEGQRQVVSDLVRVVEGQRQVVEQLVEGQRRIEEALSTPIISVVMSACGSTTFAAFQRQHPIQPTVLALAPILTFRGFRTFDWNPNKTERQQMPEIKAYLDGFDLGYQFRDVSAGGPWLLLEFKDPVERKLYRIKGSPDFLILPPDTPQAPLVARGFTARGAIEVKIGALTDAHFRQAVLEFFALSQITENAPFLLLTNLVDEWWLIWITFDSKLSISQTDGSTALSLATSDNEGSPFSRRSKFVLGKQQGSSRGEMTPGQTESADVGNMEDVAEQCTPDELQSFKLEKFFSTLFASTDPPSRYFFFGH
eukprot:CAMPEP_0196653004 /NCGR_PEP_ID=MMETSP1086-20130531/2549_1 /TAXON_ID=77921 /ORGANISM="Cyanoptyche  gloeocystis , Strain SAG4.97" /LENGTH=348 /DNA_ID=CAMNT_0041983927 /DNA_START=39 /DNA_END=1085 /DNA_ORIENTATION=-